MWNTIWSVLWRCLFIDSLFHLLLTLHTSVTACTNLNLVSKLRVVHYSIRPIFPTIYWRMFYSICVANGLHTNTHTYIFLYVISLTIMVAPCNERNAFWWMEKGKDLSSLSLAIARVSYSCHGRKQLLKWIRLKDHNKPPASRPHQRSMGCFCDDFG